jgi:hypothetical protein
MRDVIRRAVIVATTASALAFGGLAWRADQAADAAATQAKLNAHRAQVEMADCNQSTPPDCSMADYWLNNAGSYMSDASDAAEARALYTGLAWQVPLGLALLWLVGVWITTGRLRPRPA